MRDELETVEILVARGLAKTKRSAYWLAANHLPPGVVIRVGSRVLIAVDALNAWLAAGGTATLDAREVAS